ncbi:hypothetical protein M2152_002006 [Microbacteriaceae bacterium SG_E_30_P1]|uniref:Uncharacterized protein n=1 Tax=Antiquaquibacter oligotrophicus TaxID=2880260 RepID=A0ABT6KRJ4_9MICO|nr:hypothetical protein [Antiquaquibacter oligotrophicus]MDH6181824.1 hypothetical protein [Antiquaquibacter oligotrophicus]UDF12498.1 hypothetical protein LH407_10075 [Antiquaquibacter oligotrophicus]
MNRTKLASRLHFMASQLKGEAQRQSSPEMRDELRRSAAQCAAAFRKAYSPDPEELAVAVAILDGAIDYLVGVIITRTEHELAEGNQP